MPDALLCAYVRTPIGRYGGALATIRPDDLAAIPIRALTARHGSLDPAAIDEVYWGAANQSGEDNRNVARMASLLAGLPDSVPGTTLNRLCGSGMDAVLAAARAVRSGDIELAIAGGSESMSRAPFVVPKAEAAWSRAAGIADTTIGWRFVNPSMQARYGVRFDAGDGGERRRGVPHPARGPGRVRAALPAAGRRGHRCRTSSPRRSFLSRCRSDEAIR